LNGAFFAAAGALLGFLHGDGLMRGALGLLAIPALCDIVALMQIAYLFGPGLV
jgi:hypothetical protein